MVGGNDVDKCGVPPQLVGMEVYTLARDLVRCGVNNVTVCQVLRRNFWRHFSYQEGGDRVSCVNELLLAGMQWTRQCCFLEAPRHVAGRSRYISERWVLFQFPRKFQTVQECTGGYIPGKPVVSALARLRKQGNAKWNVTITAEDGQSTHLMCQRKCEGSKVICSICGGVYKKIFFKQA